MHNESWACRWQVRRYKCIYEYMHVMVTATLISRNTEHKKVNIQRSFSEMRLMRSISLH